MAPHEQDENEAKQSTRIQEASAIDSPNTNNASIGPDEVFESPDVTLRRQFKYDDTTLRSDTNRMYRPKLPSRPNSAVSSPGLTRMYSVGGTNDVSYHNVPAANKIRSRNGGMLLQVVLPPGLHNSATNLENLYSSTPSPADASNYQNGNIFRVPSIQGTDIASQISHRSKGSSHDSHSARASTPKERSKMFRDYLSSNLGWSYAILLVVLALIIHITDVIVGNSPTYEIFNLVLLIVAFAFLIYLFIDIGLYKRRREKYVEMLKKDEINEVEFAESPGGFIHFTMPLPSNAIIKKPLPHDYCFMTGRHGELLYIKIGATVFCLGHLSHCFVVLGYELMYIGRGGDFFDCGSVLTLILDFLHPLYSFTLLIFIYKYANVIINKRLVLARLGIMHCIGTGLSFWIWVIVIETMNYLRSKLAQYENNDEGNGETFDDDYSFSLRISHSRCEGEGFNIIYQNISPYLFPFSVEFYILTVGILFMIYNNIGLCKSFSREKQDQKEENEEECHSYLNEKEESNIAIHVDCHASSKGLFAGIFALILCIITIILFFIAVTDEEFGQIAMIVNTASEILVLGCMIIACLYTFRQLTKLDVNSHSIGVLDDILLFICHPAFFIYFIFSIVPMVVYGVALDSVFLVLEVVQVVIQTSMIIDGIRRCSNCKELRKKKPGREFVMFLIICNVALWVNQTFSYKGLSDERHYYYGLELWVILGHICLPLKMFYRFHSSVCLVDIWKYAYEPAGH